MDQQASSRKILTDIPIPRYHIGIIATFDLKGILGSINHSRESLICWHEASDLKRTGNLQDAHARVPPPPKWRRAMRWIPSDGV